MSMTARVLVVEASMVDVQGWLAEQQKAECRWLWMTLRDIQPILTGRRQGTEGPVVVVLHQTGMRFTSPELVWFHLVNALQAYGQPSVFSLALTGGNVLWRLTLWREWLSFVTRSELPLFRLYSLLLLHCFLTKEGVLVSLLKLMLRVCRQGKT